MRQTPFIFVLCCLALFLLFVPGPATSQQPSRNLTSQPVELILNAHRAWARPPASIDMRGVSTRDGVTQAFHLLATAAEEVLIEYGDARSGKNVVTPQLSFRDDGQTITFSPRPPGFYQLDVTGIFFISQLTQRPIVPTATDEFMDINGVRARKIRVENSRKEVGKGGAVVQDRVDIYATEEGALAAIGRTFFDGKPERYTLTYTFSDYKETEGVFLPYRVEAFLKGKRREIFQITEYRFDVPTERTTFTPRKAQ